MGSGSRARPLGTEQVGPWTAGRLVSIARWWAPAFTLLLMSGAWWAGIPASGEGGFWELFAQAVLLAVYLLASMAVWRWPMPGATVMAVMAFAIGALSGLDYPAWFGILLALLLWVPAGLHWVVWQRNRSLRAVGVLATVLVASTAITGYVGWSIYEYLEGPQTPQSAREPYPDTAVRWIWSSAVTETSFEVTARLDDTATSARLVVGPSSDLAVSGRRTPAVAPDQDTRGVRLRVDGLAPGTRYHYAVEVDGTIDLARQGQITTYTEDPSSVMVAFASCQRNKSNAEVFETIRELEPDLFIQTGDLHYSDITENNVQRYVDAYDRQLSQPAPQALYLTTPAVYIWDDHDYGPDDADRFTPSRPAAVAAYRALAAHHPLALPGEDSPVAQAFSVGPVRVIVTDLRSARDPSGAPDEPGKSMLGPVQRAWFERELVESPRSHAVVVWVSSVPWIVDTDSPGDSWGAYSSERAELARFVADQDIDNLILISGDAHMLAADDGTHNDYADTGTRGFPVLQAAALDRPGSFKGGPYSQGSHPGPGQFGLLRVTPSPDGTAEVRFEGRTWDDQILISLDMRM